MGLFIAIRDRHRWLLDVNIVLALVTMMSNKAYLGAAQKPWDPILFGVLLDHDRDRIAPLAGKRRQRVAPRVRGASPARI